MESVLAGGSTRASVVACCSTRASKAASNRACPFSKASELVSSLGKSDCPSATGNAEVAKLLDNAEVTSTSTASSSEAVLVVFPTIT